MYNDPNYNQTNQSDENGGYSYSSNGYNTHERDYNNTSSENAQETNGYDSNNSYSDSSYSSNNYSNSYDSNSYDSNSNSGEYNSNDYSTNSDSSNSYNANQYDYNTNQYDYNPDQHTSGYGQESPQYMDLLDKTEQLSAENKELRSSKKALRVTLFISIFLLIASIGYLVFSEIKAPLFGKWPKIALENKRLVAQGDTLQQLKQSIDSLQKTNNILVENITPPEQRGVFFEVQIGAFQSFDLQKYMEDLARLRGENVDGVNKYTLGRFRNYKQAEAFKSDIQRMGIADAFLVATVDGQRVEVQEAIKASKKYY